MVATPQDPSFVREYTPQKAYTKSTVHSLQNVDPYDFAGARNRELRDKAESTRGNLFTRLLGGFLDIGQLLGSIADAFLGRGSFGPGPLKEIQDRGILITGFGQQLQDLSDFVGTGITTPIWSSAGGLDLVTFPDKLMQIVSTYTSDGSYDSDVPAFRQDVEKDWLGSGPFYGTADFAFLRGGRDTPTPMEVVRIITGADSSLLDVRNWFIGLYVYDKPNARMVKYWDSGDIKGILTSQRRRYHIATGMTQQAANDQLLAIATLQLAPGAAQSPRSIGCIRLTGISEQAGTVPQAQHATLGHQSTLPASVPMSAFSWNLNRLMWGAIGGTTS